MKDKTYAVLNEQDPNKQLFPLESKMRVLSMFENTCVYALLDCCREPFGKYEQLPHEVVQALKNSKGEIREEYTQVNEESNSSNELFTITFGCGP